MLVSRISRVKLENQPLVPAYYSCNCTGGRALEPQVTYGDEVADAQASGYVHLRVEYSDFGDLLMLDASSPICGGSDGRQVIAGGIICHVDEGTGFILQRYSHDLIHSEKVVMIECAKIYRTSTVQSK